MKTNEIKIFENEEFGEIRTLPLDDESWFVGRDVAKALGYSKPRNAIAAHVDYEDKTTALIQGILGGTQKMTIINESGLYSLIFSSKLPSAKKFKRWVTSEVLPTIRKTATENTVKHLINNCPDKSLGNVLLNEKSTLSSNINIYYFCEFPIRVIGTSENPMFCLPDVCKALSLEQVSRVKSRLIKNGVTTSKVIDAMGRYQDATFINEANLYKTIFQSRKPIAEKFTNWVTSEVLPTIRKPNGEKLKPFEHVENTTMCVNNQIAVKDNNIYYFNDSPVRTAGTADNPLFCLSDVCKILGINNVSDVKKRLRYGVVIIEVIDRLGRKQNATFITESDLYKVIFQSRKKEAEEFTEWVTSEVLPTIRRTGKYELTNNNISNQNILATLSAENQLLHNQIDKIYSKMERMESLIKTLMPPPRYTNWKIKMSEQIKELSKEIYGDYEFENTKKIYCNAYQIMRKQFDCDINEYQRNYLLLHPDEKSIKPIDIIDMTPELMDIFEAVISDYVTVK